MSNRITRARLLAAAETVAELCEYRPELLVIFDRLENEIKRADPKTRLRLLRESIKDSDQPSA